ncbi:MAG: hypothetical protein PCFJNLEI_00797 [Verrucomicrobiae bacterium]|nr:hypothetical protein [Verrucomicrobiae bacterium]
MEQPLASAPVTARPTTPRDPQDVLQQILAGLGHEAQVTFDAQSTVPRLLITTAEPGRLIGKHGQTLSQLQFLVNRILFRHDPNAPRVTIDCEGYRDKQNDDLLNQCSAAASRVRRWGDDVQIGPFGATERNIILEHFARDVEVEALSAPGDEAGRKNVTIRIRQTPLVAPGQARS